MAISPWHTNKRILEALGLDGHDVMRLTIDLEAGCWPTVTVWRRLDDASALASVIERYELRERG